MRLEKAASKVSNLPAKAMHDLAPLESKQEIVSSHPMPKPRYAMLRYAMPGPMIAVRRDITTRTLGTVVVNDEEI
jgi:hypothetical protein